MDKTSKKTITGIVNKIVNYGYVDDVRNGQSYLITFTKKGDEIEADIVALSGEHIGVQYASDENGNPQLEVPLPEYNDEAFVEDEREALELDLSFLVGQWLADLKHIEASREGGKKASANLTPEKRKERASKAARARWGQHKIV